MAIIKSIELDNGITVLYHRVVSVSNITNFASIIEIASYTSKEKRIEEKGKLVQGEDMDIFIHTIYHNKEYTKELNVDNSYDYLKTLDMFSGCTDD